MVDHEALISCMIMVKEDYLILKGYYALLGLYCSYKCFLNLKAFKHLSDLEDFISFGTLCHMTGPL